jgi:hypothetical protein
MCCCEPGHPEHIQTAAISNKKLYKLFGKNLFTVISIFAYTINIFGLYHG